MDRGRWWLMGLFFGLVFTLANAAAADVVILKDGARLEGDAEIDGDVVVVTVDGGEIRVDKNEVRSMVPSSSHLRELEAREAKLGPRDVEGRIRVASWAQTKGLASNARRLYLEVVALNENHAIAREQLGFRKTANGWKKPVLKRRPLPARPRRTEPAHEEPALPVASLSPEPEAEELPPLTREEWDQISWYCISRCTVFVGARGGGFGSWCYQSCMVEELGTDDIGPPDEQE